VVLIIGSEQNPIGSILCPLVGAVAAGNAVIVLPALKCVKSAKILRTFFVNYLDDRFYKCLIPEKISIEEVAALQFDMICFSGNEETAKVICKQASQHLTPVHLELESSCPTVVDSSANLKQACSK
jgi:acyl-CoA reductase-like NAD-dependent aldehyde dehydrogenase